MSVADLDAVVAVDRSVGPDPWSRGLFADELAAPDRVWLVAGAEASVCGFVGAMQVIDEVHIMNIAVDPGFQRRGVGSLLLSAALVAVVKNGAKAATLEVRSTNVPAITLYRRFGFVEAGRRRGYYEDGGDGLIMWAHDLSASGVGIGPNARSTS